jgi:hypothetical protein
MVCEGDWVGLRKNVLGSPEISDVLNICRDLSSCLEGYRMEDDHLNGMPEEGTQAYNELMEETGGAAAYDTFDFEAHLAATSGIQTDPDDSPTPAPEGSRPVDFDDPSHAADEQTGYESRFDSEDEAIEWAEANGQGQLSRDDSGILRNQFGEEMVSDSDGNLAPRPFDPNSEFPPEPPPMFFPDDDSPVDPSNPEFAVPMPPIGSLEYEALLFETGGASANPGFNYQAHLAATGQLDKLLELDPSYNPDLDPSFDGDFEAPFDEFSPESAIDRDALVNATSFEAFLAASNGVDVGALGGLLTPSEIAEVVARFGDDPSFQTFIGAPVNATVEEPDPELLEESVPLPPTVFIPPEEKLGLIRGGGREEKKAAVLDLFSEAGNFDLFANGLAATLSADEINALIRELADDDAVWETLGIEKPVLSEESDRIAGDSVDVPVETSPVFTPRDEDLNVLRTANKEAKKGAIFELLDESGSVDAFLGGLGSSLAPSEIESLAIEFAEDGDIWEALGIPQPEFDLEVPAGSEGLNDELPLDAPLSAEDLMLVGLGDPVVS